MIEVDILRSGSIDRFRPFHLEMHDTGKAYDFPVSCDLPVSYDLPVSCISKCDNLQTETNASSGAWNGRGAPPRQKVPFQPLL